MNFQKYISEHIVKIEAGYRGGVLKIDVSDLFPYIKDEKIMGAYQNYLGGGMLGCVVGASMFNPENLQKKDKKIYKKMIEECKKFLHKETNHVGDEWEEDSYEDNQKRPVSAY